MLPASTTQAEQNFVIDAAQELTSLGYVYIASARESAMEDRDGIRFLPLDVDMLPCFGAVTGVFVVRDQSIARAAQAAYPDATVVVIDPTRPIPNEMFIKPAPRLAKFTSWQRSWKPRARVPLAACSWTTFAGARRAAA